MNTILGFLAICAGLVSTYWDAILIAILVILFITVVTLAIKYRDEDCELEGCSCKNKRLIP